MSEILEPRKEPLLYPELYHQNPLWFRGAIAHRLLRIMTPKPLSRRLPVILRQPVFYPAFFFPADWVVGDPLPPGITLPPGVSLPSDWRPGDPLPEGSIIDTSMYYPEGWEPGDPPPEGAIPDPESWTDIPGIDSPLPPTYTSPSESGGPINTGYSPAPGPSWQQKFDNTHWKPWNGSASWNSSLDQWEHDTGTIILERIGTWFISYRPTKARITHDGPSTTDLDISHEDEGEPIPAQSINYPSGTEVNMTWRSSDPADDMYYLTLSSGNPNITNIEFFSL